MHRSWTDRQTDSRHSAWAEQIHRTVAAVTPGPSAEIQAGTVKMNKASSCHSLTDSRLSTTTRQSTAQQHLSLGLHRPDHPPWTALL